MLGKRPYEEVAAYMAACDVLIMPWNRSPWIQACNPVKLKEYLAVGRPVVTSPFRELDSYSGLVRVASGEEDFAAQLEQALSDPGDPLPRRERVRRETWRAKAEGVLAELAERGLEPAGG
jgi:glycosyltransferase involved in cell wall biosynthesis